MYDSCEAHDLMQICCTAAVREQQDSPHPVQCCSSAPAQPGSEPLRQQQLQLCPCCWQLPASPQAPHQASPVHNKFVLLQTLMTLPHIALNALSYLAEVGIQQAHPAGTCSRQQPQGACRQCTVFSSHNRPRAQLQTLAPQHISVEHGSQGVVSDCTSSWHCLCPAAQLSPVP